jgi:serine/threonine-protein kinase
VAAPAAPTYELPLALPEAPFNFQPGMIYISADGSRFSYSSVRGMAVAQTANPVIDVMETITDTAAILLSPDGQWAAYFEGGSLKTAPVSGGPEVVLASGVGNSVTASWAAGGDIVFADHRGLFQVSAKGGAAPVAIQVIGLRPGERILYPVLVPKGRYVLYTVARGPSFASAAAAAADARVEIVDVVTGARRQLVPGAGFAAYAPTGHLVYWSRRAIYAQRFDPEKGEPTGEAVRVLSNVAQFAMSQQGTLLYVTAIDGPPQSELVWVDPETGDEQPLGLERGFYSYPRLSPDGETVAVNVSRNGDRDIYVWDPTRRQLTDVSKDPTANQLMAWARFDGRPSLVFASRRDDAGDGGGGEEAVANMFVKPAGGAGEPARLLRSPNSQMPVSTAPDGRLIFGEFAGGQGDIRALDLQSGAVETILDTPASEANAEVSPDGAWIAYQSNETGRFEVWVQPYPRGIPTRISNQGGTQPLWTKDGTELLFRDFFGTVWAQPVSAGFKRPARRILEPREYHGKGPILMARTYDVSKDGRLLMTKGQRQDLVLKTNWFEELKRLVPTP